MHMYYEHFWRILDDICKRTLDKNIIVYGCNRGGDFIRWFYQTYYKKQIKAFVDRWELSDSVTIPHLWSFYYIYDENDIIINTTPKNIIDEFNDTGEDWNKTGYKEKQIINLWNKVYESKDANTWPQITYLEWLEYKYGVDLTKVIKRKFTTGKEAHGYFPTEFRIFMDGMKNYRIGENDAVLDIGSGKGSGLLSFLTTGFKRIGAVEYTDCIFEIMDFNLNRLGLPHTNVKVEDDISELESDIICYQGDAAQMQKQLDKYNWFFFFNPFSWEVMEKVLNNICRSLRRKKRKIYIFYVEPICHKLIMDTEMFELINVLSGDYSEVSYYSYIYSSI